MKDYHKHKQNICKQLYANKCKLSFQVLTCFLPFSEAKGLG